MAIGSACAAHAHGFHALSAFAALGGALAIQVGTNFANDLFDGRRGADRSDRLGPPRAYQLGWLNASDLGGATAIAFVVATSFGLYLAGRGGWPVIAVGLAAIASGIGYTAGRFALAYVGLGELFVFAFYGVVAVSMTAYVQALHVPTLAWWLAPGPGLLAANVLVINNLRDHEADRRSRKRTLVVRFGRIFGLIEFHVFLVAALVLPLLAVYRSPSIGVSRTDTWTLARLAPGFVLVLVPLAWRLAARVRCLSGRELNAELAAAARFLAVYSAVVSLVVLASTVQ